MKIAVIGSNSYIARNLIKYLLDNNFCKKNDLYLYGTHKRQIDGFANYTCIDFQNISDIKKINFSCDIIYYFSGKTGTVKSFLDASEYTIINEISLLNFLNGYVISKSKSLIVYPSSRLVYKGSNLPIDENGEKELKTVYASNKFACENHLKSFSDLYGVRYLIYRICVPYGTMIKSASSYGTIEFMFNKAENNEPITLYGDGKQMRTFTNIIDICRAFTVPLNNEIKNGIYNIGGENLSLIEVASRIATKFNVEVKFKEWPRVDKIIESGSTIFNSNKFDNEFDFKYIYSLSKWIEVFK